MSSQSRVPRQEDWPETSNPHLETLLKQKVLPYFPELKRDEFVIIFGPTKEKVLAQVFTRRLRKGRHTIRRFHLITVNFQLMKWEQEELAALIAHEMGHLVNDLKGIRPKTWEEQELAATSQAVARGFINGFKLIFQRLCQKPCWEVVATPSRERVVLRVKGRNLGGIYCQADPSVLGGGVSQTYCPFADNPQIQQFLNTTWIHQVTEVQGVCTLCKQALKKKVPAFRCSSCGMLYHQDCLNSYLKRAHLVCPSCRQPLVIKPT